MKIDSGLAYPFQERTYNISIKASDDIEAEDIAECFNQQYPLVKCVVVSAKEIISVEMKVILVGLKMMGKKK